MPKPQGKHRSKEPNVAMREARAARELTQAQLAEEIGVTEKQVSRWENGESTPRPYAKKKLCTFFEKGEADLGFAVSEEVQQSLGEEETHASTEERSHGTQEDLDHADMTTRSGRTFPRMKRSLLLGALLAVVLVLVAKLAFLPNLWGSPPPTPPPSPTVSAPSALHQVQQDCVPDENSAGYLKILTKENGKEEILCYEGIGSLSLSLGSVRKVEVGNTPAQWTYLDIAGEEHLTPMSGKPNLYWCSRVLPRFYSGHPIRILKITTTLLSPEQKCTNGTP